jgi:hypothetical protein
MVLPANRLMQFKIPQHRPSGTLSISHILVYLFMFHIWSLKNVEARFQHLLVMGDRPIGMPAGRLVRSGGCGSAELGSRRLAGRGCFAGRLAGSDCFAAGWPFQSWRLFPLALALLRLKKSNKCCPKLSLAM